MTVHNPGSAGKKLVVPTGPALAAIRDCYCADVLRKEHTKISSVGQWAITFALPEIKAEKRLLSEELVAAAAALEDATRKMRVVRDNSPLLATARAFPRIMPVKQNWARMIRTLYGDELTIVLDFYAKTYRALAKFQSFKSADFTIVQAYCRHLPLLLSFSGKNQYKRICEELQREGLVKEDGSPTKRLKEAFPERKNFGLSKSSFERSAAALRANLYPETTEIVRGFLSRNRKKSR